MEWQPIFMDNFAKIFDDTAAYLKTKGISAYIFKGTKASQSAIQQFCQENGLTLPESFLAFYTHYANGFEFNWVKNEDVWGGFSIPNLTQLSEQRLNWERNVQDFLNDPNSLDRCVDLPFRAEAFKIWHEMKSWVPFWREEDGDHFCVDVRNGQIIFDQHDWFDGFGSLTKANGIIAGTNFEEFLNNWSRFCFQPNKSFWWGEFNKFGVIKWEAEYFNAEFYRPS